MPNYGFKAYDKSSEIHFSKYNNSSFIRPDKDKPLPLLKNVDYSFNYRNIALEHDNNSIKFTLSADIIRDFKNKNLRFNFVPVVLNRSCSCVVNYADLYQRINKWNGKDNIVFYIRIIPLNLTTYFQYITRTTTDEKVGAIMIIGFRE